MSFQNKISLYLDKILDYKLLAKSRRFFVILALLSFIFSIIFTFLGRNHFLGQNFIYFSNSYLFSFYLAFSFILAWEVLSMIFTIPYSIADALGKQFEIMSLIIIRYVFEHLDKYSHIHSLVADWKIILQLLVAAFGALFIFALTNYYYKIQNHHTIIDDPTEKNNFVLIKKIVSVLLIFILFFLGIKEINFFVLHIAEPETNIVEISHIFFKEMFSIMIFFDILLVLLTMWYGAKYQVVFRTSAFVVSTLLIRLSFSEDIYVTVTLSLLAVIFAIGVSYVYNKFDKIPNYRNKKVKVKK